MESEDGLAAVTNTKSEIDSQIDRYNGLQSYLKSNLCGLTIVLIMVSAMFIPTFLEITVGRQAMTLIDKSSQRSYYTYLAKTYATELIINDPATHLSRRQLLAEYTETLNEFIELQKEVTMGDAAAGIEGTNSKTEWTEAIKLRMKSPKSCRYYKEDGQCIQGQNRYYNESLGLSELLFSGGLDLLVETFISANVRFSRQASFDFYQKDFLLSQLIANDLEDGLTYLSTSLTYALAVYLYLLATLIKKETLSKLESSLNATIVLFVFALLIFIVYYIYVRQFLLQRLHQEMHYISALVYQLPDKTIGASKPLKRCIDGAGASLVDQGTE
jgi:hypothetical protein